MNSKRETLVFKNRLLRRAIFLVTSSSRIINTVRVGELERVVNWS